MLRMPASIGTFTRSSLTRRVIASALAAVTAFVMPVTTITAATTPSNVVYEGRLLDSSRAPITSAVTFRFSLWQSGDWISSDTTGAGAVNTAATQYGGWNETQDVTPDAGGVVSVRLGNGTPFPVIDFANHKYLQVEVKTAGAPDTSYQMLDPDADAGAGTDDRQLIGSVPYAMNAEAVDGRSPGTGSGDLLIVGANGMIGVGGTNAAGFTLDADNTETEAVTLSFGQALAKELSYDISSGWFTFNDDLRITDGGGLTASGALATESGVIINRDNAPGDAVLAFGNQLGQETLKFVDTANRFEFSDDVAVNGNLTVTGLINGIDISSLQSDSSGYLRAASGGGLNLQVGGGTYSLNGQLLTFDGTGAMLMHDNATNYVYIGSSGITASTSGFPSAASFIPVARVTTAGGQITSIQDSRALASSDKQKVIMSVYNPEYQSASYQGDASDNVGRLFVSHDNISKKNFYVWTSTMQSLQDYDVILRVTLPPDFARWKNNALQVEYRSTSADPAQNKLDIAVFDTNGMPVTLSGATTGLTSTGWATSEIEFTGSPTWTAGQEMLVRLKPYAKGDFQMQMGSIRANFVTGDAGDDPNDLDD